MTHFHFERDTEGPPARFVCVHCGTEVFSPSVPLRELIELHATRCKAGRAA